MKKKLTALLLAVSMLFAALTSAGAASPKKYVYFPDTDSVAPEVLSRLGYINGYEDGTFRPDNTVTRAEAAIMIVRLIGTDEDDIKKAAYGEQSFSDVGNDHWASGAIRIGYANSYINGYEDGTFRPNDTITELEFAKMAISAAGYGDICEMDGGYPDGYIKRAETIEFTVTDQPLRRYLAAIIMYQLLRAPVLLQTGITYYDESDGGPENNFSEVPYGLLNMKNIYCIKGIISNGENGKLIVKDTENRGVPSETVIETVNGKKTPKEIPRLIVGESYEMEAGYDDIVQTDGGTVTLLIKDNGKDAGADRWTVLCMM
jgi:predicted small lipoprotein YifL